MMAEGRLAEWTVHTKANVDDDPPRISFNYAARSSVEEHRPDFLLCLTERPIVRLACGPQGFKNSHWGEYSPPTSGCRVSPYDSIAPLVTTITLTV